MVYVKNEQTFDHFIIFIYKKIKMFKFSFFVVKIET